MHNILTRPNASIDIDEQTHEVHLSQQLRLWQRVDEAVSKNIKSLDLSNIDLTKINAEELQKLAAMIIPEIVELDLCDTKLNEIDPDITGDSKAKELAQRQHVYNFILTIIRDSKSLKHLSLSHNELGSHTDPCLRSFLAELFQSMPFSSLSVLNLGHNNLVAMPNFLWKKLFQNMSTLDSLNLSGNNIMIVDEDAKLLFQQSVARLFPGERLIGLDEKHWNLMLDVLKQNQLKIDLSHNDMLSKIELQQIDQAISEREKIVGSAKLSF